MFPVCSVRLCHPGPSGAWIYPVHDYICHSDIVTKSHHLSKMSSFPHLHPIKAHSNYGTFVSCPFLSTLCHPRCPHGSSCVGDSRYLDTPHPPVVPRLFGALGDVSVGQLVDNSQLTHSSYHPQATTGAVASAISIISIAIVMVPLYMATPN